MDESYPVPPPELVQQWLGTYFGTTVTGEVSEVELALAAQAARWGYQQRVRSSPECPLVERVADAIAAEATSAGIVNDRPARAAILQVAMWLRERGTPATGWAMLLEQEASQ